MFVAFVKIIFVQPLTIVGDVTNESDVKKIIDSTIEHFGRIDVLVNQEFIICLVEVSELV